MIIIDYFEKLQQYTIATFFNHNKWLIIVESLLSNQFVLALKLLA